jgi:predicted regulator of Ras-like GTPase activity (Roadblock/LC7/MglB family)
MLVDINKHLTKARAETGDGDVGTTCQRLLDSVAEEVSELTLASLTALDGRTRAHTSRHDSLDAQRIAAVTSSLLALSESVTKETSVGGCQHSTITAEHGYIVVVRVPAGTDNLALAVGADQSAQLSLALRLTLDIAGGLASIVDGR